MEKIQLNAEQLDALKEMGNIGAGNAATALSQLLQKKVYIDIPELRFLDLSRDSSSEIAKNSSDVGIAFALRIYGLLNGGMLVLFRRESALLMTDVLLRRPAGSTKLLTLSDISALSESSHILSSSYLSAIGEFLGLYQLIPSISQTVMDRIDSLNEILVKEFIGPNIGYVIPIENQLVIDDIKLDGLVVLLLEYESVMKILKIMKLAGL